MKSAIAVITFRRLHALQRMVEGLRAHCPQYPTAIFEDCGQTDGTVSWFEKTATNHGLSRYREDLMATQHPMGERLTAFAGHINLGVAGNSNRALKWFMDETDADHLLLCNDDLEVLGDFAAFYGQAHRDLDIGFFAFNDFWESPTHRWIIARSRGYRLKLFRRMTGIMMSVTRQIVNKAGYFDTRFGKFGEEHCDWTNRIRFCGGVRLDGVDQWCIDVEPTAADGSAAPPVLRHQDVETSMSGPERAYEDKLSVQKMAEAAERYRSEPPYRPFSLVWPSHAGVGASGIKLDEMPGYTRI
jgi:glycosyltransferase involved in cell wall biosynthesis